MAIHETLTIESLYVSISELFLSHSGRLKDILDNVPMIPENSQTIVDLKGLHERMLAQSKIVNFGTNKIKALNPINKTCPIEKADLKWVARKNAVEFKWTVPQWVIDAGFKHQEASYSIAPFCVINNNEISFLLPVGSEFPSDAFVAW
jgi:hypothetical protein